MKRTLKEQIIEMEKDLQDMARIIQSVSQYTALKTKMPYQVNVDCARIIIHSEKRLEVLDSVIIG